MKKIFATLFFILFAAFAAFFIYFQISTFYAIQENWSGIKASLVNSKKINKIHPTYSIEYEYSFNGVTYRNKTINFKLDNKKVPHILHQKYSEDSKNNNFHVFVDQNNPEKSVVDISVPIKDFAFSSSFLIFPLYLGVLIIFLIPYLILKQILKENNLLVTYSYKFGLYGSYLLLLASPLYCLLALRQHLTIFTTFVFISNILVLILIAVIAKNPKIIKKLNNKQKIQKK